ncbi:hypothetical protein [Nocardiopsis sp. LOL_012]|uniref:hypothetical protein n=1 Tax=Nocardiopsis sp. LOL_012 TaxID=3345409 RepID=UPI003A8821E3
MYLVHLTFLSPQHKRFPCDIREMIESASEPGDGLEHISVHQRAGADPVIGLFLRSHSLDDTERTASRLWRRTVEIHCELREYQLFRCEVPLIDDTFP